MISRLAAVTITLALVGCLTTGCQPEPDPSPSGPAFATEEEAFAAAEETYRAYVDALNQVDLSDPETFEAVYAWTTGELNASDRKNFSAWHADGYTKSGAAAVRSVDGLEAHGIDRSRPEIVLNVCYDVSEVDILDRDGASVVAPDRPAIQELAVSLTSGSTSTELAVESIVGAEIDLGC